MRPPVPVGEAKRDAAGACDPHPARRDERHRTYNSEDEMMTYEIEQLARDLCDMDAAEADATLEDASAFPEWDNAGGERRDYWRQEARKRLAAQVS